MKIRVSALRSLISSTLFEGATQIAQQYCEKNGLEFVKKGRVFRGWDDSEGYVLHTIEGDDVIFMRKNVSNNQVEFVPVQLQQVTDSLVTGEVLHS